MSDNITQERHKTEPCYQVSYISLCSYKVIKSHAHWLLLVWGILRNGLMAIFRDKQT